MQWNEIFIGSYDCSNVEGLHLDGLQITDVAPTSFQEFSIPLLRGIRRGSSTAL